MKVIFHPTHGMNIDVELSTNARNVGPQFGPKFAVYRFVPAFRAEHHVHDVLCVGMRHVPHLRCSAFLYTTHPALTRWAKVCRASGARTRPSRHGAEGGHGRSGCCPESTMPRVAHPCGFCTYAPSRCCCVMNGWGRSPALFYFQNPGEGRSLPAARSFKARRRVSSSAGV